MIPIGVQYAKQHLSEILRRVEAGEEFVITNRGEEIAVLKSTKKNKKTLGEALSDLHEFSEKAPIGTFAELMKWKDEGKK